MNSAMTPVGVVISKAGGGRSSGDGCKTMIVCTWEQVGKTTSRNSSRLPWKASKQKELYRIK